MAHRGITSLNRTTLLPFGPVSLSLTHSRAVLWKLLWAEHSRRPSPDKSGCHMFSFLKFIFQSHLVVLTSFIPASELSNRSWRGLVGPYGNGTRVTLMQGRSLTYPQHCAFCSRDGQPGDLSSASYPPLISQPPQTFSKSMYHPLSPLPGDHGFSKKSGCSHIAERDAFWFAFGSNDWAVTSQALLALFLRRPSCLTATSHVLFWGRDSYRTWWGGVPFSILLGKKETSLSPKQDHPKSLPLCQSAYFCIDAWMWRWEKQISLYLCPPVCI